MREYTLYRNTHFLGHMKNVLKIIYSNIPNWGQFSIWTSAARTGLPRRTGTSRGGPATLAGFWKNLKKKLNNYFAKKRGVDRSMPQFTYQKISTGLVVMGWFHSLRLVIFKLLTLAHWTLNNSLNFNILLANFTPKWTNIFTS